jgi:hypothetical protein
MKSAIRLAAGSFVALAASAAAFACGAFTADSDSTTSNADASADALSEGSASSDANASETGADAAADDAAAKGPLLLGLSPAESVISLVVDKTQVVWTTGTSPTQDPGVVYVCPKTGCLDGGAKTVMGYPGVEAIGPLAGDGVTAYVSFDYAGGQTAIVSGTALNPIGPIQLGTVFTSHARPEGLFLNNEGEPAANGDNTRHFYLWDGGTLASATPNFVGDLEGGTNYNTLPAAVTKDYAFLGVIDVPGIFAAPLFGNGWSMFLVDPNLYVGSMTSTNDLVIWTDGTQGVRACAQGATCIQVLTLITSSALGSAARTVVANAGLLLTETDAGDLFACTLPACTDLRMIAHVGPRMVDWHFYGHTMFADDTAIYWIEQDVSGDAGVGAPRLKMLYR